MAVGEEGLWCGEDVIGQRTMKYVSYHDRPSLSCIPALCSCLFALFAYHYSGSRSESIQYDNKIHRIRQGKILTSEGLIENYPHKYPRYIDFVVDGNSFCFASHITFQNHYVNALKNSSPDSPGCSLWSFIG